MYTPGWCGFTDGEGQSKSIKRSGLLQIPVYSVHMDETNARAAVQKAPGNLSQIKDFQTDQGI